MSIADNNAGIQLNGFTNTSLGAELFETTYPDIANRVGNANGVNFVPKWVDNGGWVNAPWFVGADKGNLRVKDYYFGKNWATIPETLPNLNVVGAFALIDEVSPTAPPYIPAGNNNPHVPGDFEWWIYHVVGVHEFNFDNKTMKITDSNKDRAGTEFFEPDQGSGKYQLGGDILKGPGVLDDLLWDNTGKLTNNGGIGIDDEELISLRVIYLLTTPNDFGDAPDSYKTLLESNGPRYDEGDLQRLGEKWDREIDGQPTVKADGDDKSILGGFPVALDDEDGVIFGDSWVDVTFNISRPDPNPYQLRAWWDTNYNGVFDHTSELYIDDLLTLAPGIFTKRYNLGFNPKADGLYSRFRLTWDPLDLDVKPFGEYYSKADCNTTDAAAGNCVSHGEVEDYVHVPEPSSIFGLLAFGGLGLMGLRKKR
ncbi:MAG: PEP-CTERM sorting domain-containing protein [Microcystis viridis Mv_BB_P_19951000_S69]|uniref:PEP-CTERM sorting domain-containing protein n=1 Tax=Microcystis viridis Mv_BB_P_19951000_S68D TaxID=2486270 RepID=A0A552HCB1_MICVR|nr:MAG: PEP-CTERM sorting domain-containing protein [Microcystis viridis Mv_BB_P_19951000_S68D]TRU71123.1 MAG: PEP-CTERM sorting domain-containing protein [Microcystis viridis Mv_BB_P_19951000_S68]TRU74094.1 MAG: PEP-CTERM sorting domain-containing protein [Microcystis viridis Mv_BB_P_19951000_S69]TRU88972.1 MAG: PEP-CTERM sorting domain-containing protein [Microcystis viridis Mv_BB_P_19951000_S69D]